jgi:hypothetical protein
MSSRNQQPIPPWMVRKRPRNADSPCPENIEKHQEILSFVRYISLNSEQKAQRNEIVESIRKVIRQLYPTAEVRQSLCGKCARMALYAHISFHLFSEKMSNMMLTLILGPHLRLL